MQLELRGMARRQALEAWKARRGPPLSPFLINNVFRKSFSDLEENFNKIARHRKLGSGSTANIISIMGDKIVTVNLGDSRAILCRGGKGLRLTKDHKPGLPEEKRRVKKAGGTVQNNGSCSRIIIRDPATKGVAGISVSRSFGDVSWNFYFSLNLLMLNTTLSCWP